MDLENWVANIKIAIWLWIGFLVVLLSGSAIWERVPWKLAVLHAGDWLLKLLMIAFITGLWR